MYRRNTIRFIDSAIGPLVRPVITFAKILLIFSITSAQTGVLIPSSTGEANPKALSLAVMNVDIVIDNQHATVRVTQIFENHTPRSLEGKYIFALPQTSAIADFAVWDNTLRIPGVMMEKRQANAIYAQITQEKNDPGILQTTDESINSTGFSARIFPIEAFGTKRLEMEYSEILPVEALSSHFVLPLKPSYGESQSIGEFNLTLRLVSDIPVTPMLPSAYPLNVTKSGSTDFSGEFHASNITLAADFVLDYRLDARENGMAVIAYRAPEKISAYDLRDPSLAVRSSDGYFQARAVFADQGDAPRPPKRVVLLLDTSLSMYGEKLGRAVEALDFFLHGLSAGDEFNLVLFGEETALYSPKPVAATAESVEGAMQFVKASSLAGGTNIKKALESAVLQSKAFSDGKPAIVLISDANPTLGTTQTERIAQVLEKSNARLFAFAFGQDANENLLAELTAKTNGYFERARETEDIGTKLGLFFDKISATAIENLKLTSSTPGNVYDIYPSRLNSYLGSDVSFVGRYRLPRAESLTLNAAYGDQRVALSGPTALPEFDDAHSHLPRVWAKARIDALLRIIDRIGERKDYIAEIIRLSEKYKLVTPYTAFLAAPRALLRPRLIQPGDPVIRVKTDPSVTEVFAVLPFGETLPLKFLTAEGVWETRFLAPAWMTDGTYKCRLLLTDKDGNGYQEEKTFVVDSRAPSVKIDLDRQSYAAGDEITVRASADKDTARLTARLYGAKPTQLRWSDEAKRSTGILKIPAGLASGRYTLTVSAEDFAHNQSTAEILIEVIAK